MLQYSDLSEGRHNFTIIVTDQHGLAVRNILSFGSKCDYITLSSASSLFSILFPTYVTFSIHVFVLMLTDAHTCNSTCLGTGPLADVPSTVEPLQTSTSEAGTTTPTMHLNSDCNLL